MAPLKSKLLQMFSLSKEGSTPLNWKLAAVIFTTMFVTAVSLAFMSSFLPAYILYFGYKEEEKGYYVGIVIFSFYAGRIIASYFWGWLSDKIGRRPVVLTSLVLTSLATIAFGFCPNLIVAIVIRCLCGLFFGIGAIKAVVYEASDNSNQGAYISIMVLGFGSGKMVGPAISGFLAQPAEKYPEVFAADGFFAQFPFILPCIPVFILYIFVIIHGFMHLTETLQKDKSAENEYECEICEKCKILQSQVQINQYLKSSERLNMFYETSGKTLSILSSHAMYKSAHNLDSIHQKPQPQNGDHRMSFSAPDLSFRNTEHSKVPEHVKLLMPNEKKICVICSRDIEITIDNNESLSGKENSCMSTFKNSALYLMITNNEVRMSILLFTIVATAVTASDEVFPIWTSTAVHLDGLGFDTKDIGSVLAIMSAPVLIIQLFLFAVLERKIGARKTFMLACFAMMVMTPCLPITRLIQDNTGLLWVLLVVIYGTIRIGSALSFSASSIFVNNCSSPANSGAINGMGIALSSLGRALGPLFSGSMFAWSISEGVNLGYPFDVNFAFLIMSFFCALCVIAALFLPLSLDKQNKVESS